MKISFDFDGTLEYPDVQEVAKELIDKGYEVCILTTRYSDPNNYTWFENKDELAKMHNKLFAIAKTLGITEINFTEYKWKTTVVDKLGINIHIDDNYREEVIVINVNNMARAVYYTKGWKDVLYKAIERFETQD